MLVIEKDPSCKIHLKDYTKDDLKGAERFGIFGVLGIVNIRKENFLVVVTEREQVASIRDGVEIFEVTGVRLEAFNPGTADINTKVQEEKQGLAEYLTASGFYFSYHTDLSLSMQEIKRRSPDGSMQSQSRMGDARYIWNYNILKDFFYYSISDRWLLPVIQGFCTTDGSQRFMGRDMKLTLLSRRRKGMAGTRFNARGIDEQGNVANFVETELIVNFNKDAILCSHV